MCWHCGGLSRYKNVEGRKYQIEVWQWITERRDKKSDEVQPAKQSRNQNMHIYAEKALEP